MGSLACIERHAYFFICPIYALLFAGLMPVSLVLCFIKHLRQWSSYVACGALGTFPGFVLGNIVFWLVALGVLTLVQKSVQHITSDIADDVAPFAIVLFLVGGLAVTNIGGCAAGFFGGVWIRSKYGRKNAG